MLGSLLIAGLAICAADAGHMPRAGANARAAAACPSLAPPSDVTATAPYVQLTFVNECGETVPLLVDIAATAQDQERGLMEVGNLPADEGELFAFQNLAGGNEVVVGFWMEDTPIPLSIAFIARNGTVNEIQDMQAETTNIHLPRAPYLYAIEANLGWFAQHQIISGSTVDLSPALAQMATDSIP